MAWRGWLAAVFLGAFIGNGMAFDEGKARLQEKNLEIEVVLKDHALRVKRGDSVIEEFFIAYGRGGSGKNRQGDGRTPEGVYRIVEVRPSGRFHLFMLLDYPNDQDIYRAYRERRISEKEFDSLQDARELQGFSPSSSPLGGQIGIHGLGGEGGIKEVIHESFNWTSGCIAMRDKEIERLSRLVSPGTVVRIVRESPVKSPGAPRPPRLAAKSAP